jgi:hypothetical protein
LGDLGAEAGQGGCDEDREHTAESGAEAGIQLQPS